MTLIAMPATRAEWLALRHAYIGASESPALFGVQAGYALDLFALHQVKSGRVAAPHVGGPRVKWGQRLEEVVALAVAEEHAYPVQRGRYAIADDCPGMGASLDFEIPHDPSGHFAGPGVLETKNVDWMVHRRSWTDGEPPLPILLQLQHQLACTGWSWGMVAALVGGNSLSIYPYAAQPALIASIKQRVTEFWSDLRAGRPPDPTGADSAAEVLRAMYPETTDDLVDLRDDNELPEICAQYRAASAARLAAEKAEAAARNRLVARLGPHRRAMAQGFWIGTAVTPARPDGVITAEMVGQPIPGRRESRRYSIKPMQQQEIAA